MEKTCTKCGGDVVVKLDLTQGSDHEKKEVCLECGDSKPHVETQD